MSKTKNQSSWVLSHDLYWENKMNKRKRSIDLLTTDKSGYFAQPRSIIIYSLFWWKITIPQHIAKLFVTLNLLNRHSKGTYYTQKSSTLPCLVYCTINPKKLCTPLSCLFCKLYFLYPEMRSILFFKPSDLLSSLNKVLNKLWENDTSLKTVTIIITKLNSMSKIQPSKNVFWLLWSRDNDFDAWGVWNFWIFFGVNRPFYSCVLSCLAFVWIWGWSWPCFDRNLTAFLM